MSPGPARWLSPPTRFGSAATSSFPVLALEAFTPYWASSRPPVGALVPPQLLAGTGGELVAPDRVARPHILHQDRGPERDTGGSRLEVETGRTDDDLIDVDIGRLLDREGDGARNRGGGDSLLVQGEHGVLGGAGRVVLEIALHGARRDRRYADLGADLLAKAFGDRADGELGAGIDSATRRENLDASNGTQVDDVAAFLAEEQGEHRGNAVERALDVDVDHRVPFLGVGLGHGADGHDAGIVEEHVELAEVNDDRVHHRLDLRLVGYVEQIGLGLAALRGDFGDDGVELVLAPRGDRHLRALGGEMARCLGADAGAATGDEDDLILDAFAHDIFLRCRDGSGRRY